MSKKKSLKHQIHLLQRDNIDTLIESLVIIMGTDTPEILGNALSVYGKFTIQDIIKGKPLILEALSTREEFSEREKEFRWRRFFYTFVASIEVAERIKREKFTPLN